VSYLGSKAASGACEAIIALMPQHDTYIETHLGTGAVMLRKPLAARSIGIDLDPAMVDAFPIEHSCERLSCRAEAYLADFDYAGSGRVFIYADPPYVLATRTSRNRYKFDYVDQDHEALAEVLHAVPAAVAISGYVSSLYERLYASWRRVQFQVMTRGGPRTECVWMNYDAGNVVLSNYVGQNFTDRQRIKRKVARWEAKFGALPQHERDAVFAALLRSRIDGSVC
jgi:site-specific DNA-adenine methylase